MNYSAFAQKLIQKLSKGVVWAGISPDVLIDIEVEWDMFQAIIVTKPKLAKLVLKDDTLKEDTIKSVFKKYLTSLMSVHNLTTPRKSRSKYKVIDLSKHPEALNQVCVLVNLFGVFKEKISSDDLLKIISGERHKPLQCSSNLRFSYMMGILQEASFLKNNWQSRMNATKDILSSSDNVPLSGATCRTYLQKGKKIANPEEPRYDEAFDTFQNSILSISKSLVSNK